MREEQIIKNIKQINLVYCRGCKCYLYKNGLLPLNSFLDIFDNYFLKFIEFEKKPEFIHVDKNPLREPLKKIEIELTLKATINGKPIKETYIVPVKVEYRECTKCSRMKSFYYEGILQLRNNKHNDYFTVYKIIIDDAEKMKKKGIGITKQQMVENGVDFYFTSQKYIQQIGTRLYNEFGGEFKVNAQLFSRNRQTSKDVYRVNVLYRLPERNINDIISYKNKKMIVKSFSKDTLICSYLDNLAKKLTIKANEDIELITKADSFMAGVVITRKPFLEVMHPETYQNTRLENVPVTKNDIIRIVVIDGLLWAVE